MSGQSMAIANAFEVLPQDIRTVLNLNWPRVVNPEQVTPDVMAHTLYGELNIDEIGVAAVERGGFRLNRQLQAAFQEIQHALEARGLLQ